MKKSERGVNLEQGESFTLKASGAVEVIANATGDIWYILGERHKFIFMLDITASATAAGDTLDVYIDVLAPDATTWLNAIHFTQQAGNGSAKKEYAVLDTTSPGTSVVVATSDAASAAVRPALFGSQYRARWTVVDAGGHAESHTFSVTGYAI